MGETNEPEHVACSIERALDVVGDRWVLLLLRDAFRGLRRYDDFRRDLDIPRAVLADRLKRLVDAGVFERRQYQTSPARFEYRLTAKGRDLSPVLVAFMRWGDQHLSGDDGPPTVLVHTCGHELDQEFICWQCNQVFSPGAVRSRPGPGAHPEPTGGRARARSARHAPRRPARGRPPRP